MIPPYDLVGWSLFWVLQDHGDIDYGTSSLDPSTSTFLLFLSRTSPLAQNQRASCPTPDLLPTEIPTRESQLQAMAKSNNELFQESCTVMGGGISQPQAVDNDLTTTEMNEITKQILLSS